MRNTKHWAGTMVATLAAAVALPANAAGATSPIRATSSQPVAMAAPYEYLTWGSPQPPAKVITTTGVPDLTLAFVLAHKGCNPEWNGTQPLEGGSYASAVTAVRNAGGNVDVSFGGWSGAKLGIACTTVAALVQAYQTVINDFSLTAIDIDIENTEVTESAPRERVIEALAQLQSDDPSLEISVTFGTNENGPDSDGEAMITQAASLDFQPYAWTIMPFDFGSPVSNMASVSIEAAKGLEADVANAYGESASDAYGHTGISSMNGDTDDSGETVTLANFKQIVSFAESEGLARLTFWAVNRDRSCTGSLSTGAGSCSGISQSAYAYTDLVAGYHG
jgi:hypothetical protein